MFRVDYGVVKCSGLSILALACLAPAPAVLSAGAHDLYVQTGTDPAWQALLDAGAIPVGQTSSAGVTGSDINVLNASVEVGPNAGNPIINNLRLHTLGNSSVSRGSFDRWSRWYQEDGNTQVFRLFEGETNVRNDRPNAARIEAFEPSFRWQWGDGWQKWQATYTITNPINSAIFQAKNSDNHWSVMLNMNQAGDVTLNRRRGEDLVMATDVVGKPFDVMVYDNGLDYRVYFNGVFQGEGQWDRPTGTSRFRWGMYVGDSVPPADAMLFVTGAKITPNAALPGELLGDLNADGELTNADINAMVLALTDPAAYGLAFPGIDVNTTGDFTGDQLLTNGDIAGFVDALTGAPSPAAYHTPAAVPEPTSLALLGLGGLLVARRRRG